jgi:hypothetical protein
MKKQTVYHSLSGGIRNMERNQLTARVVEGRIEEGCMDISYPIVEGLPQREVEERINQLIQEQVRRLIPPGGCDEYMEILGRYRVELNERGILSLRFEFYTYAPQAAHGLTVVKSLTVDLETGEVYEFRDLFRPGSHYRLRISRMIEQQIKDRDIPLINEFKGITDAPEFYLTDRGLVIYFQLYQYAPYYYGILEFPIPYSRLASMINPRGPLARLVRTPEGG